MSKTCCYEKVVIIGYGKIVGEIIKCVYQHQKRYGYLMEYIEYEAEPFRVAGKICDELGILCCQIKEKEKLTDYFLHMEGKCLIISAGNNYLFPAEITDNPKFTVLNFHNALLPEFPGRNAPSWAIFEEKTETGITWHYVTKEIDGGDIIIQKRCRILPDIRAYELAEKLMRLGYEGFSEKFDEIIENRTITRKQHIPENRVLYKSTDIPGDCTFRLEDPPEYIYRLLRAVDYGKYGIFPPVITRYQGKEIKVIRYCKILSEEVKEREGKLYLPLDAEFSLQISWAEVSDNYVEGGNAGYRLFL